MRRVMESVVMTQKYKLKRIVQFEGSESSGGVGYKLGLSKEFAYHHISNAAADISVINAEFESTPETWPHGTSLPMKD